MTMHDWANNFEFHQKCVIQQEHEQIIEVNENGSKMKMSMKEKGQGRKMTQLALSITAFCLLQLVLTQPPPPNQNQTTPRPSQQMFGRPQVVQQPDQNQVGGNLEGSNNASSAQVVQFQQGDNGCPPLFGNNFPSQQQTLQATGRNQCQWVIISDRNGCPMFFQNCGSNPPMCNEQNEIWWQCTSQCEPSCGNPRPNCRQSCGRSGCQCFPGFLRNQNGFCVPSNQCPSFEECRNDNDCEGSSMICRNGQCQQGCTSNNACRQDEQCSNGRCVERRNCERSSQCRNPKICFGNQCRTIGSIFCRFHSDCPGSSFCNRNGRCQFPFRNSDNEVKAENTENGFFF